MYQALDITVRYHMWMSVFWAWFSSKLWFPTIKWDMYIVTFVCVIYILKSWNNRQTSPVNECILIMILSQKLKIMLKIHSSTRDVWR